MPGLPMHDPEICHAPFIQPALRDGMHDLPEDPTDG